MHNSNVQFHPWSFHRSRYLSDALNPYGTPRPNSPQTPVQVRSVQTFRAVSPASGHDLHLQIQNRNASRPIPDGRQYAPLRRSGSLPSSPISGWSDAWTSTGQHTSRTHMPSREQYASEDSYAWHCNKYESHGDCCFSHHSPHSPGNAHLGTQQRPHLIDSLHPMKYVPSSSADVSSPKALSNGARKRLQFESFTERQDLAYRANQERLHRIHLRNLHRKESQERNNPQHLQPPQDEMGHENLARSSSFPSTSMLAFRESVPPTQWNRRAAGNSACTSPCSSSSSEVEAALLAVKSSHSMLNVVSSKIFEIEIESSKVKGREQRLNTFQVKDVYQMTEPSVEESFSWTVNLPKDTPPVCAGEDERPAGVRTDAILPVVTYAQNVTNSLQSPVLPSEVSFTQEQPQTQQATCKRPLTRVPVDAFESQREGGVQENTQQALTTPPRAGISQTPGLEKTAIEATDYIGHRADVVASKRGHKLRQRMPQGMSTFENHSDGQAILIQTQPHILMAPQLSRAGNLMTEMSSEDNSLHDWTDNELATRDEAGALTEDAKHSEEMSCSHWLRSGLDRSTQENSLEKDEDQDLQDDLAVFQKTPRLFEEATQGAVLNFVSWIWGAGGVSNGKIERETIGNTSMPCAGDAPCDPRLSERSKVTLPDDEMAHDGVEDSGDLKSWTLLECKEMLEKAIAEEDFELAMKIKARRDCLLETLRVLPGEIWF